MAHLATIRKGLLPASAKAAIEVKDVVLTCSDEVKLAATIFAPPVGEHIKSAILVAPATGVKRQFYSKFSQWLSAHGHAVMTFDNRGIGDSLIGHIRDCRASLSDWGSLDMPAAWEEVRRRFPNAGGYHIAGHSAGGQLVGLMHNAVDETDQATITSMFNVASSSGSIANMDLIFGLRARFFLDVFIPLNNLMLGYSNIQWLAMGEPLPYHVGRQWGEWCNGQGYVRTAFGREVDRHWYDKIVCPSMWIHVSDDNIANIANVRDMISVHSTQFQDAAEVVSLRPLDYGLNEIGHMRFFSSSNKILWNIALQWFAKFDKTYAQ